MKKEIVIGFLTALIATFFGCYLFIEYFSNKGFYETIKFINKGNLESKVLVIGAIANFFVFFVFLKKKQIYRARGVLLATFLIAFLVLFLTIFGK